MKYSIELLEEYEKVNFYTVRIRGEKYTEAEKFLLQFPSGCKFDEDVDIILSWLEKIAERGALERYFKPEGKYGDGVCAVPVEVGYKVRLYCLRLSDHVLVIGNGGVKDSDTWQNSPTLAPHVELLIQTSRFVHSRIRNGQIGYQDNKILTGNLQFNSI